MTLAGEPVYLLVVNNTSLDNNRGQDDLPQLAFLLGSLPHAPLMCPDPANIAARLVALLPRRHNHALPVLKVLAQAAPDKKSRGRLNSVICFDLIFMLFSGWLMGSLQASRQIEAPPTSVPNTNSPPPPTSSETP